jgi:hypothetical protein
LITQPLRAAGRANQATDFLGREQAAAFLKKAPQKTFAKLEPGVSKASGPD